MSAPLTAPHHHRFLGADHDRNARRVGIVIALTAATMVGEIVAGSLFGSMALVADGWHMATHAGAMLIAALAYRQAGARPTTRASPSAPASSVISPASPAPCFWRWWRC